MTNKEAIDILKNTAVVPDIHPDNVGLWDNAIKTALEALEQQKVGEWIKEQGSIYKCSKCRNILDFDGVNAGRGDANFCPNCGAKMEDNNGKKEVEV